MTDFSLDLDFGSISDTDITLLQEEGSSAMPDFAASCCEACCGNCCGSCTVEQKEVGQAFAAW